MGHAAKAPLIEVFASIQGEGRFVGSPMVFVRTAVCPIRCLYCDTPDSYVAPPEARVGDRAGERREPNPVGAARTAELARSVAPPARGPLVVSVTGGEPLLYPEFVRELGVALHAEGGRLHLETAALHPTALRTALDAIDHVSADYKLPGTLERGDYRQQHRDCIALAVEAGVSVDVKFVLTPAATVEQVGEALEHLADLRTGVVAVLQPVTPFGAVSEAPASELVARCAELAMASQFEVLVLPQVHKMLGLE